MKYTKDGLRMKAVCAAVFAGILVSANTAAQDAPVMVVTGSKVEEDAEEAVTAVEVISREDIESMGAKNVEEVLANIPGVVIFQMSQATASMQGFEGAYVKILIDGVEVTGDTGGAAPVNLISVGDIERIEIVRGASSVLYGSDAMGGVINIITKKPAKDRFSFQTRHEFASNLRYFGEAFLGYDSKYFAVSLGGSFDLDDGKINPVKNVLGKTVNLYEVPYARLAVVRGTAAWHHPGGNLELSILWGDSLYKVTSTEQTGYSFAYPRIEGALRESYKFSDTASLDAVFSYHRVDYAMLKYDYLRGTTATDGKSLFQDIEGEARFSWAPLISHDFLFGLNLKRDALKSDSFFGEKSQVMVAAFAQDTWNVMGLDVFRIVPGLRFDWRIPGGSDEDNLVKLTPKLALRYDPIESLTLRLSYGMGFKTPSLKQNYWVFFHPQVSAGVPGFVVLGNPNLKPETSHGFNLSADYAFSPKLSFNAGAYFNYILDMIESMPGADEDGERINASGQMQNYHGTYLYQNVGKAMTAGGDISVKLNIDRLNIMAAYNLMIAKGWDENKWTNLTGRVPHQITLFGAYTIPVIETIASLRINWCAPQLTGGGGMSGSTEGTSPDYLMLNFRLSKFFFDKKLEVFGGIQNLLNNIHFVKGSDGRTQEEYFGLYDGIIFSVGAAFKW